MESRSSWSVCNHIQLSNRTPLAIFRHDVYPTLFAFSDRSQTTIDHDVHRIADISGSPQDLASMDVYPV